MFKESNVCISDGKQIHKILSLLEGCFKQVALQAKRNYQLYCFLMALLASPFRYKVSLTVEADGEAALEALCLLNKKFKVVEWHGSLKNLPDDRRNVLFLITNGRKLDEVKEMLCMSEGTFKGMRTTIYKCVGEQKNTSTCLLATEEKWWT